MNDVKKTATISACGKYRYELRRQWGDGGKTCVFVLLNPSTADARADDATSRRCMAFAHLWGYDALVIINLFAFRATKPEDMKAAADPVGPENEMYVKAVATRADLVVCGWGTHGSHLDQNRTVVAWLNEVGAVPTALRLTKDGHPGHPLYLPKTLKPFKLAEETV